MSTAIHILLCTVYVMLSVALAGCGGEKPNNAPRPRIFVSRQIGEPYASDPAGTPNRILLQTLTIGPGNRAEWMSEIMTEGKTAPGDRYCFMRCIGTWKERGDWAVFEAERRWESGLEKAFKFPERRIFEFRLEVSGTRLTVLLPPLAEPQGNKDDETFSSEVLDAIGSQDQLTAMFRFATPFVLEARD